ncbi:MAG TPA: OmpH family outer membrane protein [Opitutaceae bacterium]|jgi:outer membrane protein
MKKYLLSLATVLAFSATSLTSHAQTQQKIMVVDLTKIFENHWKTKEQQAKLQTDAQKAQEQLAQITKDGNSLVAEFKELDEQSKNPTATTEAQGKAKADAQKKYEEIQQKHNEEQQFVQTTRQTLAQRYQTFKTLMLEDISKTATDISKQHGATVLLDKSGVTGLGVSAVVYADPSLDITDEVMAEVNKDAPAATPAPTSAAAATPASEAPPKITVPGIEPSK